jgi:hypothetical protein
MRRDHICARDRRDAVAPDFVTPVSSSVGRRARLGPPEGGLPLLDERSDALEEVVGAGKLVLNLCL